MEAKLMKMLNSWPKNAAASAVWLEKLGISRQLRYRYQKSGWIKAIGNGAFSKLDEQVSWEGGLYSIQQEKIPIHVGGLTAVGLLGAGHYLRFGKERIDLFSSPKTVMPKWFKQYKWDRTFSLHATNFLSQNIGLKNFDCSDFSLKISSRERAILECLYLAPNQVDLVECYQILENMNTLRPKVLQSLLESCNSIKVKRLFLCFAEQINHPWFKHLDRSEIALGSGSRMLRNGYIYMPKYKISIPQELVSSYAEGEF